jgi:hypothetical protein
VMVFRPQGFWPSRAYEPERGLEGSKRSRVRAAAKGKTS